MTIEKIDTRSAPESTLRALHRLDVVWDAERLPDDPPVPEVHFIANLRNVLDHELIPRWVVWSGDEVVATAGVEMDLKQNLDNAFGWLYVHPGHRGKGLGRALASEVFDEAADHGRTRFGVGFPAGSPEEALALRAGMRLAYKAKRSRLLLPDLDWDLMRAWIDQSRDRATDYELIQLSSPVPQDKLEAFCALTAVMNTAPREDYEEEDEILTPEMWRDVEDKFAAIGREILITVARHRTTPAWAGYTSVAYQSLYPELAWQMDTGVDPAHRNRGLGRWLKATMAFRLASAHPEVKRIDTYNAGSNRPMLAINVEMGFRPILVEHVYQGELATIRSHLGV